MGYFKQLMKVIWLTILMIFLLSCKLQESVVLNNSVSAQAAFDVELSSTVEDKVSAQSAFEVEESSMVVDRASVQAVAEKFVKESSSQEQKVLAQTAAKVEQSSAVEEAVSAQAASSVGTGTTKMYLPALLQHSSLAVPVDKIFGAQISRNNAQNSSLLQKITQAANQANFSWIRHEGLRWYDVEEQQGVRNWPSTLNDTIISFNNQGLTPMIIVQGTPSWAQKVKGSFCSAVKEDALDDFANFMREAVRRYSVPPYNVTYWEMGNEIDADPTLVSPNSPFGCWGDQNDAYYGGGYYAEMLKRVYPAIKEADPNAQVILGGLLLDCDHTNPPQNSADGCLPSKFLEGVLRNGGGDYFDIMAYHAYMSWGPVELDWDLLLPTWDHRGGALLGKLDFVKEVLSKYNVDKPIMMNEGGLLCHPSNAQTCAQLENDYRDDQANYAIRLYTRTAVNNLLGSVWYTLDYPGWRDGPLLDENQEPRPAFKAIEFLSSKIKHGNYTQSLSSGNVEGYEFSSGNQVYQIYWTNDSSTGIVTLPQNAKVYNKLGTDITPSGSSVIVAFEPIIIEKSN